MNQSDFDAAGFVEFDLDAGVIRSSEKEPLALVPLDVLGALQPGETLDKAARNWGQIHGNKLSRRLGDAIDSADVEALASHLGGTTAALGMGRLSIEIHRDALMFRSKTTEAASPGGKALLTGFLAGYLSALTKNPFQVVAVEAQKKEQLFWAANPQAVKQLAQLTRSGLEPLEAIQALAGKGGR